MAILCKKISRSWGPRWPLHPSDDIENQLPTPLYCRDKIVNQEYVKYEKWFEASILICSGIEKMNALWKDMENLKVSDRGMIWNSDLVETLELQNCMINAQQVWFNVEVLNRGSLILFILHKDTCNFISIFKSNLKFKT